jgi:hypothetical protein
MIKQAAGAGGNNINSSAQDLYLRLYANAAIDADNWLSRFSPQADRRPDGFVSVNSRVGPIIRARTSPVFPASDAAESAAQMRRFAGAGLSKADHILALHDCRYRLLLDRCRHCVAEGFDPAVIFEFSLNTSKFILFVFLYL